MSNKPPCFINMPFHKNTSKEGITDRAFDYQINGKFAVEWIIEQYQVTTHKKLRHHQQAQEDEILANFTFVDDLIIKYTEKFQTHAAIIVGRLQHKGLLHPSEGSQLIIKIEL